MWVAVTVGRLGSAELEQRYLRVLARTDPQEEPLASWGLQVRDSDLVVVQVQAGQVGAGVRQGIGRNVFPEVGLGLGGASLLIQSKEVLEMRRPNLQQWRLRVTVLWLGELD